MNSFDALDALLKGMGMTAGKGSKGGKSSQYSKGMSASSVFDQSGESYHGTISDIGEKFGFISCPPLHAQHLGVL